jgi:hypothetical protein
MSNINFSKNQLSTGVVLNAILGHGSRPSCTELYLDKKPVSKSYLINNSIAVITKVAGDANKLGEYQFLFELEVLEILKTANRHYQANVALVCGEAGEVCLVSVDEFFELREARMESAGEYEGFLSVLVTVNKGFEVYVNAGNNLRGKIVGVIKKPFNSFPKNLFNSPKKQTTH